MAKQIGCAVTLDTNRYFQQLDRNEARQEAYDDIEAREIEEVGRALSSDITLQDMVAVNCSIYVDRELISAILSGDTETVMCAARFALDEAIASVGSARADKKMAQMERDAACEV